MKNTLITIILLSAIPAYAEEKPLTGREYAANAIGQKESIIMQLLDEIARVKEELKKYKENSWLP